MLCLLLSLALSPPPPADATAAVRGLTARSFRTREAAHRKLAGMGERARPALRRGARHADPEVRRRCAELLAGLDGAVMKTFYPLPMIDAAWWDCASGCYLREGESGGTSAEAARYRLLVHWLDARTRDGPPWTNYTAATEDAVQHYLALGVPPRLIAAALAEMRRRDQLFLDKHHGGKWPGRHEIRQPPGVIVLPGWMPPASD